MQGLQHAANASEWLVEKVEEAASFVIAHIVAGLQAVKALGILSCLHKTKQVETDKNNNPSCGV